MKLTHHSGLEPKLSQKLSFILFLLILVNSLNLVSCRNRSISLDVSAALSYSETPSPTPSPSSPSSTYSPATVISRISVGGGKACGINPSGQLNCWGGNFAGGLGTGDEVTRYSPVEINTGTSYSFIQYGTYHTCGITSSSALKCWGWNATSQVGDGGVTNQTLPIIIDSGTSYKAVAAGRDHTCAITSSGVLKCWGGNSYAQIGDGGTTVQSVLQIIDSGTLYSNITAGKQHTCGITSAGILKCWGYGGFGALGTGEWVYLVYTPTEIDSGTLYSAVEAGDYHTCGITSAGVLKCWGGGASGRLGINNNSNQNAPQIVDSATTYSIISLGVKHTCGITTSGILKCWGANNLTDDPSVIGTGSGSAIPIEVDSGTSYSAISAGAELTCGFTTEGNLKCWGSNNSGQVGVGDTAGGTYPTPTLVPSF